MPRTTSTNVPRRFQPVHFGHVDIHENHIVGPSRHCFQNLESVRRHIGAHRAQRLHEMLRQTRSIRILDTHAHHPSIVTFRCDHIHSSFGCVAKFAPRSSEHESSGDDARPFVREAEFISSRPNQFGKKNGLPSARSHGIKSPPPMPPRKTPSSPFDGQMYLQSLYVVEERRASEESRFPFTLPFVRGFDLSLDQPLTFFVGENGSGKSTLLEAIADICGFQMGGGAAHDLYKQHEKRSELARIMRPRFRHRPRDGWFFRAETLVNFATLLEERKDDPDFWGDPYQYYGGKSLHLRSHGEAFLEVFQQRIHEGLFLVDEPEAALSPQRQLTLMYLLQDRIRRGKAQFIIATHSPIILTLPGAVIIDFDDRKLPPIPLQQTRHYQITRGILERPERYWNDTGKDD